MKKNKIKAVAGLGLAQLALFGIAAHAQDTTRVLQDVAISATKINQKQSQTGKVVTVITRQQIERSAGKTLPELLNEQANVVVNGATSNPGLNKGLFLRGAETRYTLILLDGILVTDPTAIGDVYDLRLLPIDQIDHIEIMKGGQSTLYGSDAVAGVINIVTKKNATNQINVNALSTAGSYNTYKGSIGINQKINDFSYDINFTHFRTKGVSEAAEPAGNTVPFDKDGFIQDALNVRLGYKVDSRLSINPFFRYFYNNGKFDSQGFVDAANTYFSRNLNTGTNVLYRLDKGAINLNYNYENINRNYLQSYGSIYLGRVHFADMYVNHQLGDYVKILAGIDNRYSAANSGGSNETDKHVNLFGAYGSLFFTDPHAVINLEAGGRLYSHNLFGGAATYSVTQSVNLIENGKLRLFGTVSSSFKAPDLSALYGPYGANPDLKPETSHGYEAGFSSDNVFGTIFNFRADYYNRKINNQIAYGANGYINRDEQNAEGVELESSVNLSKLNLRGYYTYLHGNTVKADVKENYLIRRPKNTVGIFAGYQLTPQAFVSLNYRYYSKRNDVYSDPVSYASSIQVLKSYNLVDAYAEYGFLNRRLKVFADVKNIFNAKYAELYGYTALGTNFNAGLSYSIR
ncbi:TonB-dependent receptor [Mucilaginibacter sp. Bleaf8]|uniref:TonB-dependent receptor plug domain-containing protein n=1 Tax=Mucilaginibacter sp. Bleaf8 TaxID=2834430 RepID=UPI001BCE4257|nr:TonB-dependent receptor [Mucilaginibacter sp. Bleaf8]MBS7563176.1 TonB-dependent receptor [Mucilaginibacter sp. Bleaf8]